ncbi:MAG: hypothetical protein ACWIPH_10020 [Ostreibacterium sp.]
MKNIINKAFLLLSLFSFISLSIAGEVDVVGAKIDCDTETDTGCRVSVTLSHADEGWNHYADRWEILSPTGEILATRVLAHPHVDEQPFTRSLNNVILPKGLTEIIIRGHDSVHGYTGKTQKISLTKPTH